MDTLRYHGTALTPNTWTFLEVTVDLIYEIVVFIFVFIVVVAGK